MKQMAHFLIIFWKEENVSAAVAHNEMYSEWISVVRFETALPCKFQMAINVRFSARTGNIYFKECHAFKEN